MFLEILSVTALASTFAFFLCGAQICYRIKKQGSTAGIDPNPFLLTLISCAFMLQYGILRKDRVVVFCNLVGFVLQFIYMFYYYAMTIRKRRLRVLLFIEAITILSMIYSVDNGLLSTYMLGNICMVLNISSIGAPLFAVGEVIRTKSTERLPLPLCIASFAVSTQWLTYGILVQDPVIKYPNFVATFLSIVQLSLFIIFRRGPANLKYQKLEAVDVTDRKYSKPQDI